MNKNRTITVPYTQKANVIERCGGGTDFYIPQGEPGQSGGGAVPINYFDGWITTPLTTTANQVIMPQTSITHTLTNGIKYDKATGIVTLSLGWWFVQYGYTAASVTNQTLVTQLTLGVDVIEPSKTVQPLIANQPQTISRTFVVSANADLDLKLICQTAGIQLSQINWFVKML